MASSSSFLACLFAFALVSCIVAQSSNSCFESCAQQRPSGTLVGQMLSIYLSQTAYNNICSNITNVANCANNCGGSTTQSTNCFILALPFYQSICIPGYQQFTSQLASCYNSISSPLMSAVSNCENQCGVQLNSISIGTVTTLINNPCLIQCALPTVSPSVQQRCSPWAQSLVQSTTQAYNNMQQMNPSCSSHL